MKKKNGLRPNKKEKQLQLLREYRKSVKSSKPPQKAKTPYKKGSSNDEKHQNLVYVNSIHPTSPLQIVKPAQTHYEKYIKYLRSKKWLEIRIKLFSIRGKKCEICWSKVRIEVHHITYDRLFNERLSDLQILCKKCHQKEHSLK